MNYSIKKATFKDISRIAPLFDQYRVFYQQKSDLVLAEEFISARLKHDESVIFMAINDNGEAIGFTQLYPSFSSVSAKATWTLNDLFVEESARKQGVAKALMDRAREMAQKSNAKGIELSTAIDNTSAQALYEALGYSREDGFYHYFLTL